MVTVFTSRRNSGLVSMDVRMYSVSNSVVVNLNGFFSGEMYRYFVGRGGSTQSHRLVTETE